MTRHKHHRDSTTVSMTHSSSALSFAIESRPWKQMWVLLWVLVCQCLVFRSINQPRRVMAFSVFLSSLNCKKMSKRCSIVILCHCIRLIHQVLGMLLFDLHCLGPSFPSNSGGHSLDRRHIPVLHISSSFNF